MIKVELHAHTADDPEDYIPHSLTELIDRAAAHGYQALAITLHNRQHDLRPVATCAAERGLVLLAGVERDIDGRHVLLINFPPDAERVGSFADLRALRRRAPHGLVVAPHPFFPLASCLGALLDRHADLFDAVELNYCYTRLLNFNRRAERWARARGKPLVGNADVHRLWQLGRTFSLVEAEPHPDAICAAIRAGRVRIETRPLSTLRAARLVTELTLHDLWRRRGRAL